MQTIFTGENMQINENMPLYPMGVAARLLDVHPRTLRIYEDEGLIKPFRHGGKRMFSQNDIKWIQCLRKLIHDENLSIQGIKMLLEYAPCWKIKNCPSQERINCSVLKYKGKKCWELTRRSCEKSCKNCEIYLKENKE
jgi:MerR family transcriptional regulator/heat shock protein HspR